MKLFFSLIIIDLMALRLLKRIQILKLSVLTLTKNNLMPKAIKELASAVKKLASTVKKLASAVRKLASAVKNPAI